MKNILVIEDEDLIRVSIIEVLEIEGYKCLEAANGREGILAAKRYQPDLILCDIKMPEMNGHEVLISLREDPTVSSIPFIFLSAMVDKKDLRTGMDLGADDYITKPFTNSELLNSVETRLKKNEEIQLKLSELTKNIARSLPHELRTPLISILGYSQLLMDKHKEIYNDQVFEFASTIRDSGLRLNRLIQNFITYSKLELMSNNSKGKARIEASLFEATQKFTDSIVTRIAKKYGRLNDFLKETTDCRIKMAAEDLTTIIEEVVDNAFKFSSPGDKVYVSAYNEKDNFVISVTDHGRGMKADQISSIGAYAQFERGQYEQQGSGLGLIISKKLTELHGGKFSISSNYGIETVVTVTIPSGKS